MKLSFPSPEFDDVVAAVCHGSAMEAEMRPLNELLRGNTSARDEYLMRLELHTRLASEPDLFPQAEDPSAGCSLSFVNLGDRRNISSPKPVVPTTRRRAVQVLALAACLVLLAAGVWSLWFRPPANRKGATSTAVAMLIRAVDARWAQSTGALRVGGPLEPGWLRLMQVW